MRNVDEKLAEWIVNIKSLWKYYLLVVLVVFVQRKENNDSGSRIFNGNTYVSDALAKYIYTRKKNTDSQDTKNKEFRLKVFFLL